MDPGAGVSSTTAACHRGGREVGVGQVHFVLTGSVRAGQLEAFKAMTARLTEAVKGNEPNAHSYDWYVTDDGSTFVVHEHYADDAAFAHHLANAGPLIEQMVRLIEVKTTYVLGAVNEQSAAALTTFGGVFLNELSRLRS